MKSGPLRGWFGSFRREFTDVIRPSGVLVVIGTGILSLGFLLSFMGALHAPKADRIPLLVVAPDQVNSRLVDGLNAIEGEPLAARSAASESDARSQLRRGETAGVLVVNTAAPGDRLLVASGGGGAVSAALTQILTAAEAQQQRTLTVEDAVPHQLGDIQGASGFYLVTATVLAGYLAAATVSGISGDRPATFRRTVWRLAAAIPYAGFVGLGAAVIADPILNALTGHFNALWGIGTLLVLAAMTVTIAFQILFGFFGIAATIIVLVVIGSPSAGGAYPGVLLPPFWRAVGPWLPNGAGVNAVRGVVYFGGAGSQNSIVMLLAWALFGTLLAVVASRYYHRTSVNLTLATPEESSRSYLGCTDSLASERKPQT